jgi:CRP/FNR family transcriptional regulator, polysaccharide utilization system transcription regulator
MYTTNHNLAVLFDQEPIDHFDISLSFKTKWKKLIANFESITYNKSQVLFNEGNLARGVHYIRYGKVKIYKQGSDGKEQIVKIANKGEFLGYRSVLTDSIYSVSSATIEESFITFIPKSEFLILFKTDRDFVEEFMQLLCRDLVEAEEKMVSLAYKPVRGRLAETLLDLEKNFRVESNSQKSIICLSREELANIVGTAKETVIRLLSEFKSEHLIRVEGKNIMVIDPGGLVRINNMYN